MSEVYCVLLCTIKLNLFFSFLVKLITSNRLLLSKAFVSDEIVISIFALLSSYHFYTQRKVGRWSYLHTNYVVHTSTKIRKLPANVECSDNRCNGNYIDVTKNIFSFVTVKPCHDGDTVCGFEIDRDMRRILMFCQKLHQIN